MRKIKWGSPLVLIGAMGVGLWLLLRSQKKKPPCGNYGDVDGDGFVTENDAKLIAEYLVGRVQLEPWQLERADVNADDKVSMADVQHIGQYVSGVRKTFEVCKL